MTELSWRHQAIIQALLSRGPLKEKDFHSMFNGLTGKNPGNDQQAFQDYLLKINKALSYVHLELRGCMNQYDGQLYYGVVNTVSDEQSKLGTKYTVPQIAFYKAIIEAIVQDATAQGVVSNMDALNFKLDSQVTVASCSQSQAGHRDVPSALKYFTISQKEKTLDQLVQDKWLNLTDGNITLGVKSFLDLRSWFRNNDVPSCHVCNEAGIKADLCQNEACTVRIHHYCLKQLFSKRKSEKVCPSCGTQWKYTVPKAEAILTDDDNEPRASQPATGSTGRKRRTIRTVDENVVESSNQDEVNEEGTGSLLRSGLVRKRSKTERTNDSDIVGSGTSQSSTTAPEFRRVTRSSARQT
ncbi:non-structural maintenance of chromosomes element 1-like protein [Senna tora]|uniref:Non-structural maintenance of chromosomes element 1 homolog n=1 Tax=Senna tora TaxID=362788 RepID=A0A834TE35_9FABA|nr:non-structural maintenance of chromosomes element 1-like protein [Senna tora]